MMPYSETDLLDKIKGRNNKKSKMSLKFQKMNKRKWELDQLSPLFT